MTRGGGETLDGAHGAPGGRGADDAGLAFVTPAQARVAGERRERLLSALADRADFAFKGSKPHLGALSPGCLRCGEGTWSCLFVGLRCNANCFFCPDAGRGQAAATGPMADGLPFAAPRDFADYVQRLGMRAVSFSGGDSLLELDLVLGHLHELRHRAGDDLYVWLYTNGIAGTAGMFARLRDAGLDEIRFNIAAVDYALDKVELAAGIIDTVVVEVPAIPEHRRRLAGRLTDMARIGVRHVNLHQLLAIGNNPAELRRRGYVVSRGPLPPVIESELAALEIMRDAAAAGLDLSIQYCAAAYKSRWLTRAQSARINPFVMREFDGETERGLVRRLWVAAPPLVLAAIALELAALDPDARHHRPDAAHGRILLDATLPGPLAERGHTVRVAYLRAQFVTADETALAATSGDARRITVSERATLHAVLRPVSPVITLSRDEALGFGAVYGSGAPLAAGAEIAAVDGFERMPSGLPEYVGRP